MLIQLKKNIFKNISFSGLKQLMGNSFFNLRIIDLSSFPTDLNSQIFEIRQERPKIKKTNKSHKLQINKSSETKYAID